MRMWEGRHPARCLPTRAVSTRRASGSHRCGSPPRFVSSCSRTPARRSSGRGTSMHRSGRTASMRADLAGLVDPGSAGSPFSAVISYGERRARSAFAGMAEGEWFRRGSARLHGRCSRPAGSSGAEMHAPGRRRPDRDRPPRLRSAERGQHQRRPVGDGVHGHVRHTFSSRSHPARQCWIDGSCPAAHHTSNDRRCGVPRRSVPGTSKSASVSSMSCAVPLRARCQGTLLLHRRER